MKYIDADLLIRKINGQIRLENLNFAALGGGEQAICIRILTWVLKQIDSLQQEQPSLPSNLDEAALKELQAYLPQGNGPDGICYFIAPQMLAMYKAGAEQMAGQGVSMEITPEVDWTDIDKFVYKHSGDNVIVQIRKINEKEKNE